MCTVLNGAISSDLAWPLTAPNHPTFYFFNTLPLFVTGVDRDFTFGAYAEHSKSQPTDYKPSMKGAWSWSRDLF